MPSPVFHAIQYLLGQQTREKLENFRGYKGAQSYPSRTKDVDDVDFSTGSVGLGVAQTLFASLAQDYVRRQGLGPDRPEGRMVALVGDAEMDEGNIFEALLEGWKHDVRNTWWIIDYNRQSLDAVVREGLWSRFEDIFRGFGWDVVILKYGRLQQAAFAEPGGERLRDWIDTLPEPALLGAHLSRAARPGARASLDDLGDQGRHCAPRSSGARDEELARLMTNLGGHDLPALLAAFEAARDTRPADLLHRLHDEGLGPAARRPQGQSCRADDADTDRRLRARAGVRAGHEWDKFEGPASPRDATSRRSSARVPFFAQGRGAARRRIRRPARRATRPKPRRSRRSRASARSCNEIAREDSALRAPASSRPRPTSPSRPTSGLGSTGAASSRARRWPTCSSASASPPPTTGSSRPTASTSSSASPR